MDSIKREMNQSTIMPQQSIKHGMYVGFRFLLLPILTLTSTFAFGFPFQHFKGWAIPSKELMSRNISGHLVP